MNGEVKPMGASFAVVIDGEIVALRPDRKSAEEALIDIYIFRTFETEESDEPKQ